MKLIASACGLSGLAVSIIAGLSAGAPADRILTRALIAAFGCYVVGAIIGGIGERAMSDAIARERAALEKPGENMDDGKNPKAAAEAAL